MATPKVNENCHYVQNDPYKCKIKLEKFHFDILYCYHYVMENGENQHTFIRRSETAFPSARHSMVK